MDPNQTLHEVLTLSQELKNDCDAQEVLRKGHYTHVLSEADLAEKAYDLAQRVTELHESLVKGGPLPTDWRS